MIATAGVLKPVPARTAGQLRAGVRLTWLHVRSRRIPAGILALAVCGALLRAALHWHWAYHPNTDLPARPGRHRISQRRTYPDM